MWTNLERSNINISNGKLWIFFFYRTWDSNEIYSILFVLSKTILSFFKKLLFESLFKLTKYITFQIYTNIKGRIGSSYSEYNREKSNRCHEVVTSLLRVFMFIYSSEIRRTQEEHPGSVSSDSLPQAMEWGGLLASSLPEQLGEGQ